jgi:hypothetical protein
MRKGIFMIQESATHFPARMFYVNDSGSVDTGYVVYSWIETTSNKWAEGLRGWLDLRKELYAQYKIPVSFELHATKFVAGRQSPSTNPAFNISKSLRRQVIEDALRVIGSGAGLKVGTVYRKTATVGKNYNVQRHEVYGRLIQRLDTELSAAGQLGIVFMDGDGSDSGYFSAHRKLKLASRNIIEDPLFQAAHRSQWIQMADLVAWVAYQGILQHPNKQFTWDWYNIHLRACDINGGPIPL